MTIAEKYAAQWMPNGEVSLADLIQAAVDESVAAYVNYPEYRDKNEMQERIRQLEQEVNAHRDNEETFADELQSVSSVPACQSVAVVGEPVAWVELRYIATLKAVTLQRRQTLGMYLSAIKDANHTEPLFPAPTHSIPAAELERLQEGEHCAEIELEAALVRFPDAPTEFECIGKMAAEVVRQYEAELDALRKDAERYRWLRMAEREAFDYASEGIAPVSVFISDDLSFCATEEDLDLAIDAAIAQEKK